MDGKVVESEGDLEMVKSRSQFNWPNAVYEKECYPTRSEAYYRTLSPYLENNDAFRKNRLSFTWFPEIVFHW